MNLFDRIVSEVKAERGRQDEKWGIQNHPMTLGDGAFDASYWRGVADMWKAENNWRVRQGNETGVPTDRNCAWDSILAEEFGETFAEVRPGLQFAEAVQTAGVTFAILDFLHRQCQGLTGHLASCPALDVDWILTAPEACDCKEEA